VADAEVTPAHIKNKSGLALIEPDDLFIKNVGESDADYRTLISNKPASLTNDMGSEVTPLNFERGDVVSEDSVYPKYVLTENELVDFLRRGYPENYPKLATKSPKKKAAALVAGGMIGQDNQTNWSPYVDMAKEKAKAALEGGLEAISWPQRKLMQKTAQAVGEPGSEDTSKSAEQITEKVFNTLGVPEDSQAGVIGKTALQTGLEFAYDPLQLVGVGAIKKGVKAASKVKDLKKLGKALSPWMGVLP
jgi:hypothetical protein